MSTPATRPWEHRRARYRCARIVCDPAHNGVTPPSRRPASDAPGGLDPLRAEWRRLVGDVLPSVAASRLDAGRDWPVRLDHCFGRIVLDAVCGRPWREVLRAPAWRHMDEAQLRSAIALAERIAAGEADLHALNARSLAMRGKLRPGP